MNKSFKNEIAIKEKNVFRVSELRKKRFVCNGWLVGLKVNENSFSGR